MVSKTITIVMASVIMTVSLIPSSSYAKTRQQKELEIRADCPRDCVTVTNAMSKSPCTPIDYSEKFFRCFCKVLPKERKTFSKCVNSTLNKDNIYIEKGFEQKLNNVRYFCEDKVDKYCATLMDMECKYRPAVQELSHSRFSGKQTRKDKNAGYYKYCSNFYDKYLICDQKCPGDNPVIDGDPNDTN